MLLIAHAYLPHVNCLPDSGKNNSIELLSPTGHLAIGTKSYHWVDPSRHEKASKNPGEFRQLIAQVWYPAKSEQGPTSPYVPQLEAYRQVWEKAQIKLASRVRTHSYVNAEPVSVFRFPVVLLSHGWQGTRSEYTSFAEELASQGYAVFGIDHPYMGWTALPNGQITPATEDQFGSAVEIMEYYGQDLKFAIDQITRLNRSERDSVLANKLDLSRIAAIGHSSGFSAVSTACREDRRIKACVNVDAPGFKPELLIGLHQPLLWIRLERAGPIPEKFLNTTAATIYELQITPANHGSIEDWDYLQAASSQERDEAAQRIRLIRSYATAFLDNTLRDQDSALLRDFRTSAINLTIYHGRQ